MTERVLNYRPSFWYEIENVRENVSMNYFPVTSAIAIKDLNRYENEQMTVKVDRTVAGSSMHPGSIELLHARRLLFDDRVSREIILDDMNDPPTTIYTLQIFDRRYEEPL